MDPFLEYSADAVFHLQNLMRSPLWVSFWLFVSNFLLVASIALVFIFYICVDRRTGYAFLVSFLAALTVGNFVKPLVAQERPFVRDARIRNIDFRTSNGFSFPSLHCASVGACSGIFFSHYRWILSYYSPYFWILNAMMMISRVVLGCHFPHDCIAGTILGLLVSGLALKALSCCGFFFEKNAITIASVLIAIGVFGAALGQADVTVFAGLANGFHFLSATGCVMLGDWLERRLIGCVCSSRNLKKIVRFALFIGGALLIRGLFSALFGRSIMGVHVMAIALSFYCTLGFSWIGSVISLFENPSRVS